MREKQMVGDMSEWAGMLSDFFRQIKDGSLSKRHLQKFLKHDGPFAITNPKDEWQEFYRKYFQLTVDLSDILTPDNPGGFERVIFIPQGLTFAAVFKAMGKNIEILLAINDLDEVLKGRNVREADNSYVVRFRERQEADEELKNRSYDQLKADGVNSITVLERLVYGFKYWTESEYDQHLDIVNETLCAGSQDADGLVPLVSYDANDRNVRVFWYSPCSALDRLRSRQAVS